MMLTRRTLFGLLAGIGIAGVPAARRYGRLTVRGWMAHKARTGEYLHVRIDGEDVTDRCVLAHDVRGYVVFNVRDGHGRHYLGPNGHVAREKRHGRVRIAPGPAPVSGANGRDPWT